MTERQLPSQNRTLEKTEIVQIKEYLKNKEMQKKMSHKKVLSKDKVISEISNDESSFHTNLEKSGSLKRIRINESQGNIDEEPVPPEIRI